MQLQPCKCGGQDGSIYIWLILETAVQLIGHVMTIQSEDVDARQKKGTLVTQY